MKGAAPANASLAFDLIPTRFQSTLYILILILSTEDVVTVKHVNFIRDGNRALNEVLMALTVSKIEW